MLKRIVLAGLIIIALSPAARAQTLTSAQLATLKAAIQADSGALPYWTIGNFDGLATYENAVTNPAFIVWKTRVQIDDVGNAINNAELAGLSTLNATRLQTLVMLSQAGVNPSISNRRAFFDDIFSGTGGTNTRAALLALWKRTATHFERAFTTGTGSDASPGQIVIEGPVSVSLLVSLQ
jgi:hypothetical protein